MTHHKSHLGLARHSKLFTVPTSYTDTSMVPDSTNQMVWMPLAGKNMIFMDQYGYMYLIPLYMQLPVVIL